MFSNLAQPIKSYQCLKVIFHNPREMVKLKTAADDLRNMANEFHLSFKENIEKLNNTLNELIGDTKFMELLDEDRKKNFLDAAEKFKKTYQKLAMINKMHGGTTMAKYEKIVQRVKKLYESIAGTEVESLRNLCASFVHIYNNLNLAVNSLSSVFYP